MDYASAVEYLEASGRFGIKLGLERVRALLEALGSPDAGMRGVLVGGTNGKGSTCAYLVSILSAAGYRVGSMPKPHLQSYTERICVDGQPIAEDDFARLVDGIRPVADAVAPELGPPTEFEMLTAAAIKHLRDAGIDWLVCEVGLGGTLDATNVLDLGVKVITSVDLDHMQHLGPDIASIAEQKAGIIRAADRVIAGRLHPDAAAVVRTRARTAGADLWELGVDVELEGVASGWEGSHFHLRLPGEPALAFDLKTRMLGAHQAENAALAVAASHAMNLRHDARIGGDDVRDGVLATRWPGRLELIPGRPQVFVDGGHNPAAVGRVVAAVEDLGPTAAPVVVFGAMADKDVAGMLAALPREWPAVFTAVDEERASPPWDLLRDATAQGRVGDSAVESVDAAMESARRQAGPDGLVLVLGSLYLAGAARGAMGLG